MKSTAPYTKHESQALLEAFDYVVALKIFAAGFARACFDGSATVSLGV
jgi:hypothetical protein